MDSNSQKQKVYHITFVSSGNAHMSYVLNSISQSLLPTSDTAKYLRLIFDSKLTWQTHILQLKKECYLRLNLLRKLLYTTYGAKQISLLRIYRAISQSEIMEQLYIPQPLRLFMKHFTLYIILLSVYRFVLFLLQPAMLYTTSALHYHQMYIKNWFSSGLPFPKEHYLAFQKGNKIKPIIYATSECSAPITPTYYL